MTASTKNVVTLEMTGARCPLPLLAAKRLLDDLPDGQTMVLISDCPGTADDLRSWASFTGYEVFHTERLNGRRTAYSIRRRNALLGTRGNVVLDMRGAACPGPILEAHRVLLGMQPGEVLVLLSNCPGSPSDVAAWTDNASVKLLDRFETAPGDYEFYLRRL
jgi:TusA-related sulfurtransferase